MCHFINSLRVASLICVMTFGLQLQAKTSGPSVGKSQVWAAISDGVRYDTIQTGSDTQGDSGIVYRTEGGGWGFERFRSIDDLMTWVLAQNGGQCPQDTSAEEKQAIETIASVIIELDFYLEGRSAILQSSSREVQEAELEKLNCLKNLLDKADSIISKQ